MSGVNDALRDGIVAAQARQFDRARSLLEQVTAESPGDPIGWFWLAIASPSAGAAIPCLRRVLEIDASHEQARSALAKMLQAEAHRLAATGTRAEARAFAAEATQLSPDVQASWLALAALTDDPKERLDALRQALAITPDDPQLRTRLRQALLYRGVMRGTDRAEARTCFREAATLDPTDPRVWQALAKLADSPAESVDALRELLRIAPNQPNAQFALRNALVADARALADVRRLEDACARWREAIEMAGGDVETWLGLAETTPNQKEAARAIETAYKLNPADEGAIAAMRRLEISKIDPSTIVAPVDAFARFESPEESLESLQPADDAFALDSSFDAFAQTPAPAEPVFAPVPVEPVSAPVPVEPVFAPVTAEPALALVPAEAAPEPAPAETVSEPALAELVFEEELVVAPPAVAATAPPLSVAEAPVVASPADTQPPVAAPVCEPTPSPVLEVATPPVPAQVEAAAVPSNGTSRRTVMIVDDSPTIRKILGLTLERAGYKVVAEPDGESAIERLTQVVPDLILLDIAMPKIDGYEVCKRIKQDPRTSRVPVVMLSGKGALFDKVKGHMAGANEYLTKPFETPAVLAVVTNYCEQAAEAVHG